MPIGDEFKGLDMKYLIGAPLSATAEASISLAESTAKFINTVGFSQDGSTRTAEFKYNTTAKDQDGNTIKEEVEIDVPMLAIVPIPNLQVDEVNIDFDMEVKSSQKQEDSSDSQFGGSGSARVKVGFFSLNVSMSGSVSAHSANTRSTDNSAKYHVDVRATNHGTPEGLARVLDIMASNVSPTSASKVPVDENGKPLSGADKSKYDKIKIEREKISKLNSDNVLLLDAVNSRASKMKTLCNNYIVKFSSTYESVIAKLNALLDTPEYSSKEKIKEVEDKIAKLNDEKEKMTIGYVDFSRNTDDYIKQDTLKLGPEEVMDNTKLKLFFVARTGNLYKPTLAVDVSISLQPLKEEDQEFKDLFDAFTVACKNLYQYNVNTQAIETCEDAIRKLRLE
ncbi:MAG: DUF2589 domain-containing protein [Cellulosilyticaceae bacterium]